MQLDEAGLEAFGRQLAAELEAPCLVGLRGPMGAGKSVLARAIARALGVEGHMPSPTYNLLLRYPARDGLEVVHLDLFRIEDPDEIWALGWHELPGEGEVVIVEWPERAGALVPSDSWDVRIDRVPGAPQLREVGVTPPSPADPVEAAP